MSGRKRCSSKEVHYGCVFGGQDLWSLWPLCWRNNVSTDLTSHENTSCSCSFLAFPYIYFFIINCCRVWMTMHAHRSESFMQRLVSHSSLYSLYMVWSAEMMLLFYKGGPRWAWHQNHVGFVDFWFSFLICICLVLEEIPINQHFHVWVGLDPYLVLVFPPYMIVHVFSCFSLCITWPLEYLYAIGLIKLIGFLLPFS